MNSQLLIHLNHIPVDGSLHVNEDLDPAFLNLEATNWAPTSPVHCTFDVSVTGQNLLALGQASITIEAACVKCLQEFVSMLTASGLALHKELDGRELVDLTEELREDILLILPSHPRCDADGSRECPATFRSAPDSAIDDSTSGASDAWNVLDQFKPKQ